MQYIPCIFLNEDISSPAASPLIDVDYQTVDSGIKYIKKYLENGITNYLVFASTKNKSIEFACENGIVKNFIIKAKKEFGSKIILHADVGLSPYSVDGHSTVITSRKINLEESYQQATQLSLAFVEAGADYITPCLSLHDQVKILRENLNKNGFQDTKIHAYSAKFSSSFYGPYRSTIQSPLQGKDKKTYQTDYSNPEEALNQIEIDEKQGADIVMVKPAMTYLDIVSKARLLTNLPLSVYHVSGEYGMLKVAAKHEIIAENEAFDEIHSGFLRCGVDFVIGYAPDHFLRYVNNK